MLYQDIYLLSFIEHLFMSNYVFVLLGKHAITKQLSISYGRSTPMSCETLS